jgi:tol-pal system protein YbgF
MMKKIAAISIFGLFASAAFAEVPVVDYSYNANHETLAAKSEVKPMVSTSGLNTDQRINRLEQQINNIHEQNLTSKIDELQQRLQKLNGQVEDQAHQIEQFNAQLRTFYQDLNQRLEKSTNGEQVVDVTSSQPVNAGSGAIAAGDVVEALPGVVSKKNDNAKAITEKTFLKEQQMYQTAIDLLPSKKYEASVRKLREYLKLYPKGIYVANAHYWLGEINFLQKNYDAAEEEFNTVVKKYSESKRVSDAMFKLALVHQNQGRESLAKNELNQIVKRYPGTSAAQLAKLQLQGN